MQIILTPDQITKIDVDHNVNAPTTQWKMLVTFSIPLEFGMEMLAAKSREPQTESKMNKSEEKQEGEVEETHIPEIKALAVKCKGISKSAEATRAKIFDTIVTYGPVTARDLVLDSGFSPSHVHRILAELLDENQIASWKKRGAGKYCVVYTESSVELDSTFYIRKNYPFEGRKNAAVSEILAYMRQVSRPVTRAEITASLGISHLTLKKAEKVLLEQGKIQLGQMLSGYARSLVLPEGKGTTDQAIQSVLDWCHSFIPAFLDAETTPEPKCAVVEDKGRTWVFICPRKFRELILENDPELILDEMKKRNLLLLTRGEGRHLFYRSLPKNTSRHYACYGILVEPMKKDHPVVGEQESNKLDQLSLAHNEVFDLIRVSPAGVGTIREQLHFDEKKTQKLLHDLEKVGLVTKSCVGKKPIYAQRRA